MKQEVRRNRKVADAKLDGIVHKSIERTVTRIKDKDQVHLNTNLIAMASIGYRQATHQRNPLKADPHLVA